MNTKTKIRKVLVISEILLLLIITIIAYRVITHKSNPYTITQYGNDEGLQKMCYSVLTPTGELIMIDGGSAEDENQVRKIINEHGGTVHAWFLTHPHDDHIGAFNEIFEDPQQIKVKSVYATDIDYENYKKKAKEWDKIEFCKRFLELMEGYEELTYLHENDEFDMFGLSLKVFHAAKPGVMANNSSLVFKLSGKKQSLLITGDVGIKLSDEIIANHKEDLKADYLQMAHHGNGGLSDEFYDIVHPSVAFFDAPKWLREPTDDSTWNTPYLMDLMSNMGANVMTYETTPNTVKLY